jgi:hypothetical protein
MKTKTNKSTAAKTKTSKKVAPKGAAKAKAQKAEPAVREALAELIADAELPAAPAAAKARAALGSSKKKAAAPVAAPAPAALPRSQRPRASFEHDPRVLVLHKVGDTMVRAYKPRGATEVQALEVKIKADGYEWNGEHFNSLSTLAGRISGQIINGFRFFGL